MENISFYNNNLTKINKSVRNNVIGSKGYLYKPNFKEQIKLQTDLFYVNIKLFPFKRVFDIPWKIKFFKTLVITAFTL